MPQPTRLQAGCTPTHLTHHGPSEPSPNDFDPVTWMLIPGGTCLYGDAQRPRPVPDLLVAQVPLTVAGTGMPATELTHDQATRAAEAVGGRLPRAVEWEWIAAGPHRRRFPWGHEPWHPGLALLTNPTTSTDPGAGPNQSGTDQQTPTGPLPAGRFPQGATPEGLLDLAGNVWEWTCTPVMGEGSIIRGGSYASPPLYAQTTFINAAPNNLRSPGIGVRPVRPAI
ncbi:formylglycine-generating enzyme family protein [Kineosporia rhizophila]|uniref:formylglycine-generating enzyme family protein n=1 Tax=Kineosporia rhizophila TaxID=84633 RepID=UPI001E49D53B|nr:SUMF1/EgtB/PvdO family nonheme iron enzyme [Kineosporia rhizophila]MCE0540740.1 formylglycine-generating enzyme family protein [Kineosporia rhizophila]